MVLGSNIVNLINYFIISDKSEMAEETEDVGGKMLVVFERTQKILYRTVTAKADEKSIRDDNFISPAGTILKKMFYFN